MNDDELENELTRLLPALPPGDYLRRLRANPPPVPGRWYRRFRFGIAPIWVVAGGGILVAATTLWWLKQIPPGPMPARVPLYPGQRFANSVPGPLPTPASETLPVFDPTIGKTGAARVAGPWHERSLDFSRLQAVPGGSYAMLDGGSRPAPGSSYDLETPAGPMRLDCCLPAGDDPNASLFGRVDLSSNQPF